MDPKGGKVNQSSNTQLQDLKALAKTSKTAKIVFEAFSERKRFSRRTDLKAFRHLIFQNSNIKNSDWDNEEYYGVFKELEKLNIGRAVRAKSGLIIYFEWNGFEVADVGKAGLNQLKELVGGKFPTGTKKAINTSVSPAGRVKKTSSTNPIYSSNFSDLKAAVQSVFAIYSTQNQEQVKIDLRNGLTKVDQEQLLEIILSLPISAKSK
jgi:hypothetical protein